jgi:porin
MKRYEALSSGFRAVIVLAACTCVLAEEPAKGPATQPAEQIEPEAETEADGLFERSHLTGEWGGGRVWLQEHGIDLSLSVTNIYQHNVHGGLRTRDGHRVTGSSDLELTLDLERMDVWDGALVYMLAESGWNESISEDRVGDLLGVNDDGLGDEPMIVSELWLEQKLWDSSVFFRLGKLDLTVSFENNAYADDETAQFLNSALVNMPTVPFPEYGLGAQLFVQPVDWWYLGMAVADAQAVPTETGFNTTFHDEDYFFGVLETGFEPVWESAHGDLPGTYRFGVWYDPQPKEMYFNDLNGQRKTVPMKRDDVGFYISTDQFIYKEVPDDAEDTQGLGVFFNYGFAHAEANELEHFWSAGAQYVGLIPTRDADILGFGFAQGILSDELRQLEGGDRESLFELYYNIEIFPWLYVSPDFQYIMNPGATEAGKDAFVAGVRVQMNL